MVGLPPRNPVEATTGLGGMVATPPMEAAGEGTMNGSPDETKFVAWGMKKASAQVL